MDTHVSAGGVFHFIILIPHRDVLGPVEEYRERLFAAGLHGAYSFPLSAPLAAVSRSFSREELKHLARNVRDITREKDGRIQSRGIALSRHFGAYSFFGLYLNLAIEESVFPASTRPKILHILSPPVLCAALAGPETNLPGGTPVAEEAPALSCRSASLANLAIRPLDSGDAAPAYSFEWKISPSIWLPKHKPERR